MGEEHGSDDGLPNTYTSETMNANKEKMERKEESRVKKEERKGSLEVIRHPSRRASTGAKASLGIKGLKKTPASDKEA